MKYISTNRFVWLVAGVGIGIGICLIIRGTYTCPLQLNYLRIRHEAVSKLAGEMWAEADYAKGTNTIPDTWMVDVGVDEDDLDENAIIVDAYTRTMKRLETEGSEWGEAPSGALP